MKATDVPARLATVWRVESPRVVARLARLVGDIDTAEELAQDTFVAALEKWGRDGVPDNPAAWLNRTARFLAIDRIRRRDTQRSKYQQVAATLPEDPEIDIDHVVDGELADDLLGLIFMSCHPILSPDARSALTLKLLCGLSTEEVARAFLAPESTIAQRIVRAKRTLAAANIRFELPSPTERPARLDAVREVIYLLFNEGYAATSGEHWIRSELCDEALRLGRMLANLTPNDTETLGLLGSIEIQASRLVARTGPNGEQVLLMDQDRTRWDQLLIRRGLRPHRSDRAVARHRRTLRTPSRYRRLPREGEDKRRDRLAAHRGALRRTGTDRSFAGGRAQPRCRSWSSIWAPGWTGSRAPTVRPRRHGRLPPPPSGGGGSDVQFREPRGRTPVLPPSRRPHGKQPRSNDNARTSSQMRFPPRRNRLANCVETASLIPTLL